MPRRLALLLGALLLTAPGLLRAEGLARYRKAQADLEARRQVLAGSERLGPTELALARRILLETIAGELLPAWEGTPWAFHGTSETPGEGEIACGYLVSTVLRDAGLGVERVALARQASERIIQTLTDEAHIWRFRRRPVSEVLARVREEGEGLYLIGLDYHVGFLVNRGGKIEMCHSSVLPPGHALCRDAAKDPAMLSDYHVLGRLLTDRMVRRWLKGQPFPTRS
ncbi:MAG: hypothetical protein P1V51_09050 [Deltaproteobacteria bacterium]|nr:hypothetical protein [Deltaproteobacteria bacterium]